MPIQNIKKISAFVWVIFLFTLIVLPVFTYSAPSESTAGNTGLTYDCGDGPTAGNCDFNDLMAAVKNVVNKGTIITLSLSVIVIAWAGFKYMTSGDNPGERKKANEMLLKVVYGIAFIIAAWLIVSLILRGLKVTTPIAF
ncbi:MAG: pilin [Candidatus Paceibacterota bacterium]|jgi:hypothetical protein